MDKIVAALLLGDMTWWLHGLYFAALQTKQSHCREYLGPSAHEISCPRLTRSEARPCSTPEHTLDTLNIVNHL